MTLAIDPGVARGGCACAAFDGARLASIWFEHARQPLACAHAFGVVLVERPVLQGDRTRAARPQDLMSLAWEGALLAGLYAGRDAARVIAWPASDTREERGWKGSEPKPIQHARLWAILHASERAVLGGAATERVILAAREKGALSRWSRPGAAYYPRAFTAHNTLDAVALGATHLGRIARTA